MSKIQIIDDIEMPPRKAPNSKYPWADLKVGQGFEIPASAKPGKDSLRDSVYYSGKAWAVRNNPKARFQVAKVGGVIRVKRTK